MCFASQGPRETITAVAGASVHLEGQSAGFHSVLTCQARPCHVQTSTGSAVKLNTLSYYFCTPCLFLRQGAFSRIFSKWVLTESLTVCYGVTKRVTKRVTKLVTPFVTLSRPLTVSATPAKSLKYRSAPYLSTCLGLILNGVLEFVTAFCYACYAVLSRVVTRLLRVLLRGYISTK